VVAGSEADPDCEGSVATHFVDGRVTSRDPVSADSPIDDRQRGIDEPIGILARSLEPASRLRLVAKAVGEGVGDAADRQLERFAVARFLRYRAPATEPTAGGERADQLGDED
jgi:hypothetical protein